MKEGIYTCWRDYIEKICAKIKEALDIRGVCQNHDALMEIFTYHLMLFQNLWFLLIPILIGYVDKLGLEMPTTTEELRDCRFLKAFKEETPTWQCGASRRKISSLLQP